MRAAASISRRAPAAPGLTALLGAPAPAQYPGRRRRRPGAARSRKVAIDGMSSSTPNKTCSSRAIAAIGFVFPGQPVPHFSMCVATCSAAGSVATRVTAAATDLASVVDLLGSVLLDRQPGSLSSGESSGSRSVAPPCSWPQLLLMDEPLAALDEGGGPKITLPSNGCAIGRGTRGRRRRGGAARHRE